MKKIVKTTFVAVFAAVAGYGINTSQKADTVSDLALANVEALAANGETPTGAPIYCCGNNGTCMYVIGNDGIKRPVAGIKLETPCPK